MKCPECITTDLLISERQGIEIDYCPSCRGVWLDKGELDKIIERTVSPTRMDSREEHYGREHSRHDHHDDGDDSHRHATDPLTGKRRRQGGPLGFLGELFD